MEPDESITQWLSAARAGKSEAAQELWNRYFAKLVRLARRKLAGQRVARRAADEEDVALSAFNSFCNGLGDGRFPQLADRDDLWKVLVTITARKVAAQRRREGRQKRGGGQVRGESVFASPDPHDEVGGIGQVLGAEPTPALAAQVADECRRLYQTLGDETLLAIARWKMEGFTNAEIAEKLECSSRTVERKLERIRARWERELAAVSE